MHTPTLRWFVLLCLTSFAIGQNQAKVSPQSSATEGDQRTIQQIEDDLLKGEDTAAMAVFDRVLADDYVNLTPGGTGPGKAEILKHLQPRAGQAPPYSLATTDMHIYILGDTAVAAYVKAYVAKEGGNVIREDTTHIFMKDHGTWKLRISRASLRKDD
jgi:hypothetical protein